MEKVEVTTPVGKEKVTLKAFITGGDKRAIQAPFLRAAKMRIGAESTAGEVSGDVVTESEDAAINAIVLEIDGSSENILQRVLAMRAEDYQFVIDEVNKITNPLTDEKKSA